MDPGYPHVIHMPGGNRSVLSTTIGIPGLYAAKSTALLAVWLDRAGG